MWLGVNVLEEKKIYGNYICGRSENNVANDAEISWVLKKLSNCYPI